MSTLYIVATPIGNLEDITLRAIRILKEVDLILCEDTRVTKKLLDHHSIATVTESYHQHSDSKKTDQIITLLQEGKSLALVTDAGTPGISDPGNKLIADIFARTEKLNTSRSESISIVPIPGPSALTAAASLAGISMDKFVFMGFPPVKNKRKKYFKEVIESRYPVIFYESSHRILKTLKELEELDGNMDIVVCRELTKQFETVYRGTVDEVAGMVQKDTTKGEFVVIVKNGMLKQKSYCKKIMLKLLIPLELVM